MYERFTDKARKVIQLANQEAQRFNHEYIGTEHILLGLVAEDSGVAANVIKNLNIDWRRIRLEIERIIQPGPDMVTMAKLPQTPRAKKVIEYSIEEARNFNHDYLGTEHLLLGLLREQEGVAAQVLMNLGLKLADVREEVLYLLGQNAGSRERSREETWIGKDRCRTPALDGFGYDLTELASQGQFDPVVCRENEIARVIQVLSCRTRNNPVLVGEPGAGKTAIVKGLAQRVVDGTVPPLLRDRRIVMLDLEMMVGSATGYGQLEARCRAVIEDVQRAKNIILFIDDLPKLVAGGGLQGGLAQSKIQCISATSLDQYRQCIEKNAAFVGCFQKVAVAPPTPEETVEILRALRDRYAAYQSVQIQDRALEAAVELSERYLTDSCQPHKAIRVMDEASAHVRLKTMPWPQDFEDIDAQIEQVNRDKEAAIADRDFDRGPPPRHC
jgi:ATP-dependent Clp protease ATP-binding subunit ClpC